MLIFDLIDSTATDPLGPGQSTDFKQSDKVFVWKLKKMEGGAEEQLVLKVCSLSCANVV